MTGSVSCIFGIDSLALVGSEAGGTDAKSALENSINYSKKAAENGACLLYTSYPVSLNKKAIARCFPYFRERVLHTWGVQ